MGLSKIIIIIGIISIGIAFFWQSVPLISQSVHAVLDPTAGALLNSNINIGMVLITGIISLFISLIQKYTVDNDTLRELKKEQKILQEEIKKYKNHPEKMLELQKKQLEFIPKTMNLTMGSFVYTGIPIILFFRWFNDYFNSLDSNIKIFGFFSWFWAYLIMAIFFSMLFKKLLKLP